MHKDVIGLTQQSRPVLFHPSRRRSTLHAKHFTLLIDARRISYAGKSTSMRPVGDMGQV